LGKDKKEKDDLARHIETNKQREEATKQEFMSRRSQLFAVQKIHSHLSSLLPIVHSLDDSQNIIQTSFPTLQQYLNRMKKIEQELRQRRPNTRAYEYKEEEEEEETLTRKQETFLSHPAEEQLRLLVEYSRRVHFYCHWCGHHYQNKSDLLSSCPGSEEDQH